MLEGPRPCTIICYAFIHYAWITLSSFLTISFYYYGLVNFHSIFFIPLENRKEIAWRKETVTFCCLCGAIDLTYLLPEQSHLKLFFPTHRRTLNFVDLIAAKRCFGDKNKSESSDKNILKPAGYGIFLKRENSNKSLVCSSDTDSDTVTGKELNKICYVKREWNPKSLLHIYFTRPNKNRHAALRYNHCSIHVRVI